MECVHMCLCLRGWVCCGGSACPAYCKGWTWHTFWWELVESLPAKKTLLFSRNKHLFFLNQTQPQMETELCKGVDVVQTCTGTQR